MWGHVQQGRGWVSKSPLVRPRYGATPVLRGPTYLRQLTEVYVEPMLHIIFHPRSIDVVEKTGGGVPFKTGMISKVNIPPGLGTGKRLAGAFFAAMGPFSTPFMLVHPLLHVQIVVNLTGPRIVMQWWLMSVIELHKGLQPFNR